MVTTEREREREREIERERERERDTEQKVIRADRPMCIHPLRRRERET